MGDTTFMKIKGKYTARPKAVRAVGKFKKHPRLARTRENANEFGTASKSGKVLRSALHELRFAKDGTVVRRLHKAISKVLHTDTVNLRGKMTANAGDLTLLIGFNFNIKASLRGAMNLPYLSELNRETGMIGITMPSFKPANCIKAPDGTTHFKIVTEAVSIDFTDFKKVSTTITEVTPLMPWDDIDTSTIQSINKLPCSVSDTLFLVVGIQFFQVAGKWVKTVKGNAANCLAIVAVG